MFIKNIETMNPYLVWTFLVHVMYCTWGVAASDFVEAVICNINLASAFISSIKFHALLFASLLDRKKTGVFPWCFDKFIAHMLGNAADSDAAWEERFFVHHFHRFQL
jgi:hypothetical protein